ncbi:hypothetical protein FV219_03505 [Methylobacterium sp. WL122]|nr:hypothetical protein FV219_03505 [Methylobacterium sp. WL122]
MSVGERRGAYAAAPAPHRSGGARRAGAVPARERAKFLVVAEGRARELRRRAGFDPPAQEVSPMPYFAPRSAVELPRNTALSPLFLAPVKLAALAASDVTSSVNMKILDR